MRYRYAHMIGGEGLKDVEGKLTNTLSAPFKIAANAIWSLKSAATVSILRPFISRGCGRWPWHRGPRVQAPWPGLLPVYPRLRSRRRAWWCFEEMIALLIAFCWVYGRPFTAWGIYAEVLPGSSAIVFRGSYPGCFGKYLHSYLVV